MKRIPLAMVLLLSAAPALGQSDLWPVASSGSTCSMAQAFSDSEFGQRSLRISYDAAREAITITSTGPVDLLTPDAGDARLLVVFLDNGRTEFDDGWGPRNFEVAREGDTFRMSTSFAGKNNVRQILADLAASRAIGFMNQGKVMTAFELGNADASLGRLRSCAAQVASN